jgi:hypothetical protein
MLTSRDKMPYLINWGKSESCIIKKKTSNLIREDLPHFPSAEQPENMRKRALDTDRGDAGAGRSGNKQEHVNKRARMGHVDYDVSYPHFLKDMAL